MNCLVLRRRFWTFEFLSSLSIYISSRHSSETAYQLEGSSDAFDASTQEQGTLIPHCVFGDAPKRGSYKQGDSTFYSIIERNAESGNLGELEKVFHEMKRQNRSFVEKNFIFLFRACGKAQSPLKAIDFFNRMAGEFQCKQTVRSFNCVLNVVIQQGLYYEALEFHDNVICNNNNILPNNLTFNLVIKALCRLGMLSKALDMFREMTALKCEPDAYTYCTLMDGLCKVDRLDDAMALLDEMLVERCLPTAATYNALINGLCRKGDLSRAGKLVDNMLLKGCIPNVVTYNTLIHGLCIKGKLDKAISLLSQMMSNNLFPSEVTCGTMISGLVKQGKAVEGMQVLMEIEEMGYKTNEYAYSSLISGLFKQRKSEEAMKLWSRMIEKVQSPNAVVYTAVIDGLCRERKPYDAEEYFLQMVERGCKPSAFTYGSLMKGFFEVGNSEKAILLWKQMGDKSNLFCCSILIHGLCNNGRLPDALGLWKHMISTGLALDSVAYTSMIHGFCNAGLVKQGLNLFNEMLYQATTAKPDVFTYNTLFSALCRHGQISHAIDLLNTMLNQCCDPDSTTCKIFLSVLRKQLEPPQDGRDFLDELVLKLQNRQRTLAASATIEIMLQNFLQPKASTWAEVIQNVCRRKKTIATIDNCWIQLFI